MMNRLIFCGLLATASLSAASVFAATPAPQYSADEVINTFAKPAEPTASTQPDTSAASRCEKLGMVEGDDGICEPAKKERGFSLPTRTNPTGAAPAVKIAPARPAAGYAAPRAQTASAPTAAPRPAAKKDLLITFELGSSILTEQARVNAKVFASALNAPALANSKFEIGGYTDASGAADRNLALSQQRADAVKEFLVGQGIDAGRITSKGFGASNFATPNNPTSPANRRVEARRVD